MPFLACKAFCSDTIPRAFLIAKLVVQEASALLYAWFTNRNYILKLINLAKNQLHMKKWYLTWYLSGLFYCTVWKQIQKLDARSFVWHIQINAPLYKKYHQRHQHEQIFRFFHLTPQGFCGESCSAWPLTHLKGSVGNKWSCWPYAYLMWGMTNINANNLVKWHML